MRDMTDCGFLGSLCQPLRVRAIYGVPAAQVHARRRGQVHGEAVHDCGRDGHHAHVPGAALSSRLCWRPGCCGACGGRVYQNVCYTGRRILGPAGLPGSGAIRLSPMRGERRGAVLATHSITLCMCTGCQGGGAGVQVKGVCAYGQGSHAKPVCRALAHSMLAATVRDGAGESTARQEAFRAEPRCAGRRRPP